ncbi:unnamed protein product [Rotaria sp. Silwood2]|nr:unnamed protein product [Rotaria sp. Silwood2]CAF4583742.1 unnamed protein product [Rotaria sp. Silwood2]
MTRTENKTLISALKTYCHCANQPTLSDIESCHQDSNDDSLYLISYYSIMNLVKLEDLTYTCSFTYSLKTHQLLFTNNIILMNNNLVCRLALLNKKKIISLDSPSGVNTSVHGLFIFDHYVAINVVDYRTLYRLYVFDSVH